MIAMSLRCHSGAGCRPEPGIHNPKPPDLSDIVSIVSMDSGLAAARRPGMTEQAS